MSKKARCEAEAESTGRLDFIGGVADYSGSLVLEAQTKSKTTVKVALTPRRDFTVKSTDFGEETIAVLDFFDAHKSPVALSLVAEWLKENTVPGWLAYFVGCLAVFYNETSWLPEAPSGLCLEVCSDVPAGMGVSSSASVEVATLRALCALSGRELNQCKIAHMAQAAENHVVGAPCGLMDQLTCALGAQGALLPILCRPDQCSAPVKLPQGVVCAGWPSGVAHVLRGESPYLVARTATFMGKAMAERLLGCKYTHPCEISGWTFRAKVEPQLPRKITGAAFLEEYGPLEDQMSIISPQREYNVAAALRFPVEENTRSSLVVSLLGGMEFHTKLGEQHRAVQIKNYTRDSKDWAACKQASEPDSGAHVESALQQVGELMLQAHTGYTEIGLGCAETDHMVEALMEIGPTRGVYGARVSGGGSGGTVVVLMKVDAIPTVEKLASELTFGKPFPGLIF